MAGHQEAERGGDNLRIDESERKSWASIAFIRAGGMFSAPTLMVGAALGLGLALSGAALATLAGFGFIVAYMCFVSMQASDLGLPTASLAAPALGRAGARYISPFVGRFDDIAEDGISQLADVVAAVNNYDFGHDVEIIAASVRSANHVTQAALMGADIATVPFAALKKCVQHPLTDRGLDAFMKDWEKVQQA